MESKPPAKAIPFVPLNAPAININVILCNYIAGNGGIELTVFDQRAAPVAAIGDVPQDANFMVGRFFLTPRALRMLSDQVAVAIRNYEAVAGTLPTQDAFVANAALSTISFKPPANDSTE